MWAGIRKKGIHFYIFHVCKLYCNRRKALIWGQSTVNPPPSSVHNTFMKYASVVSTPPVFLSSPFHPWPSRKLDQSQVKLSVYTDSHAMLKRQRSLTSLSCLSQIIIHSDRNTVWWKQRWMEHTKSSLTCINMTFGCSTERSWLFQHWHLCDKLYPL